MLLTFLCTLTLCGAGFLVPDTFVDLVRHHGWGRVAPDARLHAAAEDITAIIASARTDIPPAELGEHLDFILAQNGIIDAQVIPHTMTGYGSIEWPSEAPRLLTKFKKHLKPTHYGRSVMRTGEQWVATYLFVHRGARVDRPVPLQVPSGQTVTVRGELRRGYFNPRLIVQTPQEHFGEGQPTTKGRRFDFAVNTIHGDGIYAIELVADSRYGPTVLLKRDVFVGVESPERPTMRIRPRDESAQVIDPALRLLSLINAHRVAHSLPPFQLNSVLTDLAQEHAAEMKKAGRLTHGSPTTGTLTTRVRQRGLQATMVAENLAEARDEKAAFTAFLDSPGHARNLLIPELTQIGVGVVDRYFAVTMCQLTRDYKRPHPTELRP